MSSSITPKMEPGTADTTTESANKGFSLNSQALRINPQEVEGKLPRKLVSLVSSCPEHRSAWRYCAHTYPDDRTRGALTLRFRSKKPDNIALEPKAHDAVRTAVHAQLAKMLPRGHKLPRISFDSLESPEGKIVGLIDLVFSQRKAFRLIQPDLKTIDIGVDSQKRLFSADYWAGHIPGSTFVLDCLNLPVSFDQKALFAALSSITGDLGSLGSLGKIVYYKKDSDFEADSGTVRAYLELHRRWLTAPLDKLVKRLPSHLLWHGVPHKLLYVGYDLHKTPKYSADYPLSTSAVSSSEESSSSDEDTSDSDADSSSSDEDDSSARARKRRKTAGH